MAAKTVGSGIGHSGVSSDVVAAPAFRRRLRLGRLGLVLAAVLAASAVTSGPAGAAASYRLELYRPGDFVSQTNEVQCIGASMQMMLNIIGPTDDRTAARQLELQDVARTYSPRRFGSQSVGPVRQRRGASSSGWAAGLTMLAAGPYAVTSGATLEEAVRIAATAMRKTGKPAGLLVWQGSHAWVMSGFEATGDPLDGRSTITHVYVLDPWYPRVSRSWGASPRPHTRMTLAQLAQDFRPWRPHSTSANANRFVVVFPYERRFVPGRGPLA